MSKPFATAEPAMKLDASVIGKKLSTLVAERMPAQPRAREPEPPSPAGAAAGHHFGDVSVMPPVQAKLQVSQPGDEHEQEADRVAELVTAPAEHAPASAPASKTAAPPMRPKITPIIEAPGAPIEEEPELADKEEPAAGAREIQFAGGSSSAPPPPPRRDPFEDELESARGGGTSLPAQTRELMEARLGFDFGRVRIHTDAASDRMTSRIHALAFTHGHDIYFSPGAYDPSGASGRKVIAHELAHVVQQSGGASSRPLVQRAVPRGAPMHEIVQNHLLKINPEMVVEAPIPGGDTLGAAIEKQGYADFYTSADKGQIIGVSAEKDAAGDYHYKGRRKLKKVRLPSGTPTEKPALNGTGPFTGEFPAWFKVADFKWVGSSIEGLAKIAEGTAQLANYKTGLEAFVKQAAADKKVTNGVTHGDAYTKIVIPPGMDYKNFKSEGGKGATPSSPNLIYGAERVWIHPVRESGLYFYFKLPHPYDASEYTKKLEDAWKGLKPLREALAAPPPKATGGLPKRRGGGKRKRKQRRAIQRVPKTDWKKAEADWLAKRKEWKDKTGDPFLGSTEGKAVKEKVMIDDLLGLSKDSVDPAAHTQSKEFGSIHLWAGTLGLVLGKLRFKLGPLFDKVMELVEWLKTKFKVISDKIKGLSEGKAVGWVKTVLVIVVKAIKIALRQAVVLLFDMFRDCINGILTEIVSQFVKDITQELYDYLSKTYDGLFKWVADVRKSYEEQFKQWEDLITTVLEINNLAKEIGTYEVIIRGLLQVVACLEPPAWGCLWGLVAQLSLGTIVDLVSDTELFQSEVTRPLVKKLLAPFLSEPFKKIIFTTMDAVGLGEYAKKVKECHPAGQLAGGGADNLVEAAVPKGLALDSPEMRAKRDKWEKDHMAEIIPDVLKPFITDDGMPATKENIERLLQLINKIKPGHSKLKKIMDGATTGGKINVDKVRRGVEPPKPLALPPPPDLQIEKKYTPPPKPGIKFGPLDPIGGPGSDKQGPSGGGGVKIEW